MTASAPSSDASRAPLRARLGGRPNPALGHGEPSHHTQAPASEIQGTRLEGESRYATPTPAGWGAWRLGSIGGAPVEVAPTSLLLGLLVAASWYPLVADALGTSRGFAAWVAPAAVAATVLILGVSVLAHEFMHGLAGRLLGRPPLRYELYLWGGRTTFGGTDSWGPWRDLVTSLAGPVTNLLLAAVGHWLIAPAVSGVPAGFVVWSGTWINLMLGVFNALPALPLDGGHAVSALVCAVTGRPAWGQRAGAIGGAIVVAGLAWRWVLRPFMLGARPDAMSLMLTVLVAWPLALTSWRILGAGRRERAAAGFDLRPLARPVAIVSAAAPVSVLTSQIADADGPAIVVSGTELVGWVDRDHLPGLSPEEEASVPVSAVCQVLPAAAVSVVMQGAAAQAELRRARALCPWLILIENGEIIGAVPTGAR